jgi:hypothetical protein
MIKIGKSELSVSTPDDLDGRLIEMAGVSAKEVAGFLRSGAHAPMIALALTPFLSDGPSRDDLTRRIQNSDVVAVRQAVLALYDKAEENEKGGAGGKAKK